MRTAKGTSAGVILDPLIEHLSPTRVHVSARWRLWLRKQLDGFKTYRAQRTVDRKVTTFNVDSFKEESWRTFAQLNEAVCRGSLDEIRKLCTEQYAAAIRRGMELSLQNHGEVRGVAVSRFLSQPMVVQARLGYPGPTIGQTQDPSYAQITVRLESEQLLISAQPAAGKRLKSRKGKRGGRSTGATTVQSEWMPAMAPSGHQYYFNTSTGGTTWSKPSSIGRVGVSPVLPQETGVMRIAAPLDEAEASLEAAEGGARAEDEAMPVHQVVNYVVFERNLTVAAAPWRICHM